MDLPYLFSGLIAVTLARRAAKTMQRNVVAIKQEILNFIQVNTQEYEVHLSLLFLAADRVISMVYILVISFSLANQNSLVTLKI